MEEKRLPKNEREGVLYGGVICFVTVLVMLILNIGIAFHGFNKEAIWAIISLIPIIWIVAMALENFVIGKVAEKLVNRFTTPTDGFNAKILFQILFCVTGMSFCMTIIGGMIGSGGVSMEPILTLPSHFPRNFFVAFWCEILLAQPAARFIMVVLHQHQQKKSGNTCQEELETEMVANKENS